MLLMKKIPQWILLAAQFVVLVGAVYIDKNEKYPVFANKNEEKPYIAKIKDIAIRLKTDLSRKLFARDYDFELSNDIFYPNKTDIEQLASVLRNSDGVPEDVASSNDNENESANSLMGVSTRAGEACQNPRLRKEWRTLNTLEKQDYIRAVMCLQTRPPLGKHAFGPVMNRYDDFVVSHLNATGGGLINVPAFRIAQNRFAGIHGVPRFLPWHRYLIWLYETALIQECGYSGAQPYWDWNRDHPERGGSFENSPIFNPITGFGGDGGGQCIRNGPFVNLRLNLGPMSRVQYGNRRCLVREFDSSMLRMGSSRWHLRNLLNLGTYDAFRRRMEETLHFYGHLAINGEMIDFNASPNDPLFWLHHTQVDRVWTLWQSMNQRRLHEISGIRGTFFGPNSPIWMGFLAPDVPVSSLLDAENSNGNGILCYRYMDGLETYF